MTIQSKTLKKPYKIPPLLHQQSSHKRTLLLSSCSLQVILIVSGLWFTQSSPLRAMDPPDSKKISPLRAMDFEPQETRRFYKDAKHPQTGEFWKTRGLSERLEKIRPDIRRIQEEITSYKTNSINLTPEILENYQNILKCIESDKILIQDLKDIKYANLLLNSDESKKQKGGWSGAEVIVLDCIKPPIKIAIKKFKNIKAGLEELLFSLVAVDSNPYPKKLKMARIWDATLSSDCLNIIMECAKGRDIHDILTRNFSKNSINYLEASNAIKACAKYLALFHLKNYKKLKKDTNREKYLAYAAKPFNTLVYNPLKEDENTPKMASFPLFAKKPLCELPGNLAEFEQIKSDNVLRLLSLEEQEQFIYFAKNSCDQFEQNSGELYRAIQKKGSLQEEKPYFLTLTHGDAHGNNFFYDDSPQLLDEKWMPIMNDSFYRVTMIDFASIIKTYGDIGDPAEDVGRFLGSLWDWAAKQDGPLSKYYEKIWDLQEQFIQSYMKKLEEHSIFTQVNKQTFERIFKENLNFHKLRFYRIIANAKKDQNPEKDKDIKLKTLKSWIQENSQFSPTVPQTIEQNIFKEPPKGRPWISVCTNEKDIFHWLPKRSSEFIESTKKGEKDSYLTLLGEALNCTGTATLSSKAAIAGMGGIGKTSLALEYAHRAKENKAYNLIYWLKSETEASLLEGYRELLREMGIYADVKEDMVKIAKQHLMNKDKCLLIYDNVPSPDFLKGKTPENAHILITSRAHHGWENSPLKLDIFQPNESFDYLCNITGYEPTLETENSVKQLAEELEHFPLALAQAAHYIKLRGGQNVSEKHFTKYLEDFKQKPTTHFEEQRDPFKEPESGITYYNLVKRTLRMSKEQLSPLAEKLLVYCSYLDPDAITEEIFIKGSSGENQEKIQEAFEELSLLSLIKKTQNSIFVHRLLQLVIRQEQEKLENKDNFIKNIRNLLLIFNHLSLHCTAHYYSRLSREDLYKLCISSNAHLEKINEYIKNIPHHLGDVLDEKRGEWGIGLEEWKRLHNASANLQFNIGNSKKNILPHLLHNSDILASEAALLKEKLQQKGKDVSIEICKLLFRVDEDVEGIFQIVESLESLNNHFTKIPKINLPIVESDMERNAMVSIISALMKIHATERRSVTEYAKQLITPDMGGDTIASIISALMKVNTRERQSVTEYAQQLITPDMGGDERVSIISALRRAYWRQSFIKYAHQLITPDMGGNVRASIISALGKLNEFIVERLTKYDSQLITPGMGGDERVAIISALGKIKEYYNRTYVPVVCAKQLITPDMRGDERASIISALGTIKTGQHESVISNAKQLITSHMTGDAIASIISALANIEPDKRQEIVTNLKKSAFLDNPLAYHTNIIEELERSTASQHQRSDETTTPLVTEAQFVMDLGSSGIQLGGFKVNNDDQIVEEEAFNKKERLLLQDSLKNNRLPKEVQEKTVETIKKLLSEANVNPEKTKVIGYATAWARAAENSNELIEAIQSNTNVTIKIIDQHMEGEMGFQATLAALRSLMLNKESFLYQTKEGKNLLLKISTNDEEKHIIPENIITWDIGGGSMQLAKQNKTNKIVDVIGSTDYSTLFANQVIALKKNLLEKTLSSLEIEEVSVDTPYPLSFFEVNEAIKLSKEKAQKFIYLSFLECNMPVFGLGAMHQCNRLYINKLLGKNFENFYLKSDLEKSVSLLIDKNNSEIAAALGITELASRNRFTNMILVLGFMEHMAIDRVNTIDVNGITGVFFTDTLHHPLNNSINREAPKLSANKVKDRPKNILPKEQELDPLERSKQESRESTINEGRVGPRKIPGWELYDVEDLGNCFYDAINHQMMLIAHDFLKTVPEGTSPRNSLRLRVQGPNFKDEEWAGDKEIEEFVKKFDVILAVVDTKNPEAGYVYYYSDKTGAVIIKHPDDETITLPKKQIIKIATTGNHFLSVISDQ